MSESGFLHIFNPRGVSAINMVKKFGKQAPSKKTKQTGGKKNAKYIKPCDLWKLWGKWTMRSYPDDDGRMLLTSGEDPDKFFKVEGVRETLGEDISECVRRPPMGINLVASAMEGGIEVLNCISYEPTEEEAVEDFEATGIPQVKKIFHAKLRESLEILNVKSQKGVDKKAMEKAAKEFLETFGGDKKMNEKMKAFAHLADASSRMYALAMAGMEATALASKVKSWAKKVPELEKQAPDIKKWVKKPSLKTLAQAVASVNAKRVQKLAGTARKAFKKRGRQEESGSGSNSDGTDDEDTSKDASDESRKASDEEGDNEDGSSSANAESASSSAANKKKKKKKNKKGDSDSSSEESEKKSKKKEKKQKGKPAKKKKDDRSEDDAPKKKKIAKDDGKTSKKKKDDSSEDDDPKKDKKTKADDKNEKKKKDEKSDKNDKKDKDAKAEAFSVAVTTWQPGDMECCRAAAETMLTAIADSSITNLQKLQEAYAMIPGDIVDLKKMTSLDDVANYQELPAKVELKKLLQNMLNVCKECEKVINEQKKPLGENAEASGK